jgi:hypothetical protein
MQINHAMIKTILLKTNRFAMGMLLLVISSQSYALDAFDHFKTGFPLTGQHERVDCADCHIAGRFKGTPTECGLCHNNLIAEGKNASHIISSNFCDDCHTDLTWLNAQFEHSDITSPCVSCHNNYIAPGLPPNHINSTKDCEDCHNTITFARVIRVDHSAVLGTCSSCHNGIVASGKNPAHIQTSAECDVCHTAGASWSLAHFDHSNITSPCSSCHNGVTATGKSNNHIQTSAECSDCHNTTNWADAHFDHTNVTGDCQSCHNGSDAIGKPGGHFVTTEDCDRCHTTSSWASLLVFSHQSANFPGAHRSSVACSDCHTTNSQTIAWPFSTYKPECAACHANDFKLDAHKVTSLSSSPEFWDCSGSCHIEGTLRSSEHRTNASEW